MIPRVMISSSSVRPAAKRTASQMLKMASIVSEHEKSPNAIVARRTFSSYGSSDDTTPALDDYEQIMGPAPVQSWFEDAVKSAASDVLAAASSATSTNNPAAAVTIPPVETSTTTMGGFDYYDESMEHGYRTRCTFQVDEDGVDSRPGVDSPANEL